MGGKAGKGGGLAVYRRIYDIFAAIGETARQHTRFIERNISLQRTYASYR
jgi:hypothetical protein